MSKSAYIYTTGRDGQLDRTKSAPVKQIGDAVKAGQCIVIHLHGGLVNEEGGTRNALRLTDEYTKTGAHPVLVVWRSGLLEIMRGNLKEIFNEDVFQRMLKWVIQFTVGKLRQEAGERAVGGITLPMDDEVDSELARRDREMEPFAATVAPADRADLEVTRLEEDELVLSITEDQDLRADLDAILAARHPESVVEGARGIVVRRSVSGVSLMDPDALEPVDENGTRGLLTLVGLALKCASVLRRVLKRFRDEKDHGVYCTVVEELLREFYLANAGGAIWSAMKKETQDTFEEGTDRFGRALLDELSDALRDAHAAGASPRITLVGHSTGAIYINHLLGEIARRRAENDRPWPDDARVQVVFLAPACTYENFAAALDKGESLISDLRMFTMDRETEEADRLVGALYPRSLLHLISGVLERSTAGGSEWAPLVGMARYREAVYRDSKYQNIAGLAAGQQYLTDERVVLSPSGDGAAPGRAAGATSHTTFDEDRQVLESIATMLRGY
ncbi:hypothetical protein [Streptomyces katrae]|uniref:hypothetical protein n=1 Tax=Streptomyces katrae TaxID=68223 RepID=UPI0004C0C055|nr:hypothetical protein [Streptomyces katrae]